MANEAHKKHIKVQCDNSVKPHVLLEGVLVLLYDQESDKLRSWKFDPMWVGQHIVKNVLSKGAYKVVDFDGVPLAQPNNGLYLKGYYAYFFAQCNVYMLYIGFFSMLVVCLFRVSDDLC